MIGYLSGKFLSAEDTSVLIDVSGVGYQVVVPARLLPTLSPGASASLHIHTNLRENSLELFGFADAWEKRVFIALTSVQGVGPRSALSMLGAVEPDALLTLIVRGDTSSLTKVPGIGKKTAERLVLELNDKAAKLLAERGAGRAGIPPQGAEARNTGRGGAGSADIWSEAVEALVALGYREGDAVAAVRQFAAQATEKGEEPSVQQLIRGCLQGIARK